LEPKSAESWSRSLWGGGVTPVATCRQALLSGWLYEKFHLVEVGPETPVACGHDICSDMWQQAG